MEIVQELTNQYILYIPVALVIVGAILLFTFGFKSAEQPPFDKLANEERKSLAGKKRKIKDKKITANGHVSTGESKNEKSPSKESKKSPAKEPTELKQEKKEKKVEKLEKTKTDTAKPTAEIVKNKKNLRRPSEKPVDFDDGNWETVPSKFDKKKKGDQSPDKNKKSKKAENVEKIENQKQVKEIVNRELQEKEKEAKKIEEQPASEVPVPATIDIKIDPVIETEEPVIIVEEKKEKPKKKKEKKPKKEVVEKIVAEEKTTELPVEEEKIDNQPEAADLKAVAPAPKAVAAAPKAVVPAPKAVAPAPKEVDLVSESGAVSKAPAFDELGDVWTEAKPSKKTGKKKARRDN